MNEYSGNINTDGMSISLVATDDVLSRWVTEDDVSVLRTWMYESSPLTFTICEPDGLVNVKVCPNDTTDGTGQVFVIESMGLGDTIYEMRASHLQLVIPTLLYKFPEQEGINRLVFVAVTNKMTIEFNRVRSEMYIDGQVTKLDRVDIEGDDTPHPYATSGLFISDNVELICRDRNLFCVSDEGDDVIIVIEQPQHPDYLDTIVYKLSSSFDDTLINTILSQGLPYTKMTEGDVTKYYLRVEDYFTTNGESLFN